MDLDKFVKILKLTTSPVDGEALAAVRKANEILKRENFEWEHFVLGKIHHKSGPGEERPFSPKYSDEIIRPDQIADALSLLLSRVDGLGQKTVSMLYSFKSQFDKRGNLSDRQKEVLLKILREHTANCY